MVGLPPFPPGSLGKELARGVQISGRRNGRVGRVRSFTSDEKWVGRGKKYLQAFRARNCKDM